MIADTSLVRRRMTRKAAMAHRSTQTSRPLRRTSQLAAGRLRLRSNTGRHETELERYDRNWTDIQQQLRIIQTGTQLLAGFLLTLPFQPRFTELTRTEVVTYLILVLLAAAISVLALGPVATHRLLFQRSLKPQLVVIANRILIVCLAASAVLFAGIVLLIFDMVLGVRAPIVVSGLLFLGTAALWIGVPLSVRWRQRGSARH